MSIPELNGRIEDSGGHDKIDGLFEEDTDEDREDGGASGELHNKFLLRGHMVKIIFELHMNIRIE
jgi:hypothetical protein